MGKMMKNLGLYLILIVLVVSLVNMFITPMQPTRDVVPLSYSEFLNQVDKGNVTDVTIDGSTITGVLKDGHHFSTYAVGVGDLAKEIAAKGVNVEVKPPQATPWWSGMVSSLFPTLLLIGAWIFILYHMQGGGSKVMSFAKSKAKMFLDNRPKVTFDDVAGCDEAKEELQEVIEFLRNPRKFAALGARVPRGVLLLGHPGTGKTLLARAVAGEADVPFFSISGSDFVEMFVGVGAARVRDLFEQARKYQPCIIFIDEIDAVGRHRGAGLGGGHDEREQTLNQLLVELDGFDTTTGIIVIAATNRPDILDPALLRPGRFDRQIVVDRPDFKGRVAILKVHIRDKKVDPNVNLEVIAKRTPGFVGADLANLVNEAALLAARRNKKLITMDEFEEAIDRVIAGPERKSRVISPKEKRVIALHESGHALVAKLLPNCDPVHKVSIIPRGHQALGYTMQLPEEDRFLISKKELLNQICVLLGGRVTEELKGDDITTGAQNDLERATQIARKMVTEFGMSERLGPVRLGRKQHEIFLGRDIVEDRNYSEEIAYAIDQEVRRIIDDCYELVKDLLIKHEPILDRIAEVLLEKEVLEGEELDALINEQLQAIPQDSGERLPETQSVAAAQSVDKKSPVQLEPRIDPV
ncbi:MAG TPA: ATP-dependent zinc metalloprotease FtsH [Acetomicrobium flavidum]|uniref:ATP-dependent zinc metalloprotease FtsH n=2 Tax=Acetomicrobium TaxID=49894 RepID=I4BW21_ACEMN|nr:ATP-dependent zinc metalloprotease FtsH [Acetomicrobium mobile]SIN62930.1 membrane protease FtsH catalytic subunit [Acetomicrobium flavidum]AFM21478.1 ATP-dependent metalloprotease FtsH [Acetomicrobium mobile DSM 13181]HOJ81739.1 ATP-dependent zinc metalloprotease FtsH [Acetomicrobium flavidum]HOP87099.1 ATP-dependent zinc metalloprotease FtsH [Acetomicrobium flavidum]HPP14060.1 ATP-dependent zinc metalloprotease FtsH [Acetomicrobium flavidum]